ncbi:MAG: hypothetical protein JO015_10770 [Verrucomicrobia bacterium]|nr:hypothetical protein [Verrucomicrobiota bacterium]
MPGAGPEGKGFPDLAGKGPSELVNSAHAPVANQQFWKNWSEQNQGKLADFQANRANAWTNISGFRNDQNVAGSFNQPQWNDYKSLVQNYRDNRAIEVTNNVQNNFDKYFNANGGSNYGGSYADKYASYADKYASYADKYASYADKYGGYADKYGRYADKYYGRYAEKYWWWTAATYTTAATFLALDKAYDRSDNDDTSYNRSGTYDASYDRSSSYKAYRRSGNYDYGVNVVYQGDQVYADGRRVASAKEYSQQAIALANTPTEQPRPMPPESGQQAEYLPLGVWAMVQEEKGDAYMFFQISIDKDGVVTGAFKNLLSGEESPISGQVDKKTQRAAWKIGSSNTVIEAGLQNLTQEVASCLVHFGTDTTQTWLLVRLKNPAAVPDAPQSGPVADDSK